MRRFAWTAALALIFLQSGDGQEAARVAFPAATKPGATKDGFRLPNGWMITPAGDQILLADLPLNIIPLTDRRRVLVSTNGFNLHTLALIDLEKKRVVERTVALQSWFGLAVDENHQGVAADVWWAGGGAGRVHRYLLEGDKLNPKSPSEFDVKAISAALQGRSSSFKSGLAVFRNAQTNQSVIYSLDVNLGTLTATPLSKKQTGAEQTLSLGGRPYDVKVARDGGRLFVSDWSNKSVVVVDAKKLQVEKRIIVDEHPNQIALHPTDQRLFVACSSSNSISVIDVAKNAVVETIATSLFPKSPEGSTPDALALAPDGGTLFVANADNNCIAVIDVAKPGQSAVKGFIPTGWYPTAVSVGVDGKTLLVGVGKGNQTKANPIPAEQAKADPMEKARRKQFPYIGTTMSGALSIVTMPDEKKLAEYTAAVYRNCPYSDRMLSNAPYPQRTAIPNKVGDSSPIKHVIYIIKENRTYDQVFGDIAKGDGDPSLVMFGRDVTPNHHKLAEEFVLLDNLYCNGQVSRDGHPWSTMAYATDYVARDWMLTYSKRPGVADDAERHLEHAPSGYLWDAAARAGKTYRSYGEYGRRVSEPDGAVRMEGAAPGLIGHMCPTYGLGAGGKGVRDPQKVETFLNEFTQFEAAGALPNLMILSLGEDHTTGTKLGTYIPQACVASNDLALGRLVEGVSKSRSWPKTAIFVIEDDAQNGADHVDAHRTVGLVVSPYTKRNFVDGTQYSTASMLRTIELILGLPPLSQFDAAANPMFASFTDKPDLAPYTYVPPQVDLGAVNGELAYGSARSAKMDFEEYDQVDDFELNEILWRAVKGKDAPLPPAVRRAIAYRPAGP